MTERGIDRIAAMFAMARAENRAALLPYMTAGLPDVETSPALFAAMADAGADGFEVGIPYSDPLMDGPTIHTAGLRALEAGVDLDTAFDLVAEIVSATGKPVLVMTYVNPVMASSPDVFAHRAAAAGASGVIVADLPAEEAAPFQRAFEAAGLGMVLFVAPTTDEARLEAIAAAEPAFIYGVAELGVTGVRDAASSRIDRLAGRVRAVTDVPLVFGVGISTPAHAAAAAEVGDGVIVGSALVHRVLDAADASTAVAGVADAVAELAAAVRR
jgi:tryptophan synthase alpha chain